MADDFENNFEEILDSLPTPVFRLNLDLVHTYVNRYLRGHAGARSSKFIGKTTRELPFPPEVCEAWQNAVEKVIATKKPQEIETGFQLREDYYSYVVTKLVPEFDSAGNIQGVIGFVFDITAREKIAASLEESEQRFQAFMDNALVNAWMKDEAGRYVYLNDNSERSLKIKKEDWLGRTDFELFPPELASIFWENDLRVIQNGETIEVTENAPDTNGNDHFWYSAKFPFTDKTGSRYVGGIGFDITERMKLEAERVRLQIEKERSEEQLKFEAKILQAQKLESLGVLAGGIAHDFNNILTAILGHTSLAMMRLDNTSALQDSLHRIENASLRAAELCQQMLAYSGRGQFVVRPVNINELVEQISELLTTVISKNAVLKFNLANNLPFVKADATQLRQVIMNLITNASDAIGEKSGVITVTTSVLDADETYLQEISLARDLKAGRFVYLEVSDTGSGMDEATQARIFEPFFSTKFVGRGLGLSAVQGIIRGHGGGIKVYSQVGRGTTFKVLLPVLEQPGEEVPLPMTKPTYKAHGETILVADDEEDVRILCRKSLELAGFNVILAHDGQAALEIYKEQREEIALVLLDMTMPRLDGAETFSALRQIQPDVKVVLMSGYNREDATGGFAGKGLADFLQKPFKSQQLIETIANYVAN